MDELNDNYFLLLFVDADKSNLFVEGVRESKGDASTVFPVKSEKIGLYRNPFCVHPSLCETNDLTVMATPLPRNHKYLLPSKNNGRRN